MTATETFGLPSLMAYLDASPTPFHAVRTTTERLVSAGYSVVGRLADGIPTKGLFVVDGTVVAWSLGTPGAPLRIVGAHTDSPNLRVQPVADIAGPWASQLGIEIYGGVLLNSWLDRDLGIAGRVVSHDGSVTLFRTTHPVARIPQLAIHLDREINERGLLLDKQAHMMPVWGTSQIRFRDWLVDESGVDRIAAYDAHLFDVTPAAIVGHDSSLLASARLDNLVSCWAATESLAAHDDGATTAIVVLNDHEEVGSSSATGKGRGPSSVSPRRARAGRSRGGFPTGSTRPIRCWRPTGRGLRPCVRNVPHPHRAISTGMRPIGIGSAHCMWLTMSSKPPS